MKHPIRPAAAPFLAVTLIAGSAQGAVVLSNLSQSNNGYDPVTYLSGPTVSESRLGATFTTGNNVGGYVLDAVWISLFGQFTPSGNFTVSIYSSVSGAPGSLLATLTGETLQPAPGNGLTQAYRYSSSGLSLAASTSYWVVNSVTGGVTGSYAWNISSTQSFVADAGWTLGASYALSNPPDSPEWVVTGGDPYKLSIEATAVPEPAEYASMAGIGGLLVAGWMRRRRS